MQGSFVGTLGTKYSGGLQHMSARIQRHLEIQTLGVRWDMPVLGHFGCHSTPCMSVRRQYYNRLVHKSAWSVAAEAEEGAPAGNLAGSQCEAYRGPSAQCWLEGLGHQPLPTAHARGGPQPVCMHDPFRPGTHCTPTPVATNAHTHLLHLQPPFHSVVNRSLTNSLSPMSLEWPFMQTVLVHPGAAW